MTQKYLDSNVILKRFNSFIILKIEPNTNKRRQVLTVCDCGSTSIRPLHRVVTGFIKSCSNCKKGFIHLTKDPLHKIWCGVKARCLNPNDTNYSNYGGRGISVSQEWVEDSSAFIKYCKTIGWAYGLDIDRIDNLGNYEPGNVRFVTRQVNSNNTRSNKHCTLDGVRMTLSDASRSLGKGRDYLSSIQTRQMHCKPSNVEFCE